MRNNACGFVAVLTAIAVFPLLAFAGTSVSDATLLRMAAMKVEPVIDGTISIDEQKYSSVQYGPISGTTKLMSVRYGSFFVGYTDAGIYFAARTSAPTRPQKFTAEDRVSISVLPEGGDAPKEFFVCVADGSSNLPPGAKSAMRRPRGIDICGMECVETEMFVPFDVLGGGKPTDGAKWGLQMSVTYSSEPETAVWHLPSVPGEMGRLAQNHTHGIRPHIDAHLDDTLLVGPLLFHATVLFVEIRAANLDCNAAGKLSGVIARDVGGWENQQQAAQVAGRTAPCGGPCGDAKPTYAAPSYKRITGSLGLPPWSLLAFCGIISLERTCVD